ncbi:MAG: DNA polymerase III subunit delta' [Rhodoblastus sp.]
MSARRREEAPPESDVLDGALPPRKNKTLFGQAAAETAFLESYKADRLPHAWLIGGRQGIGKATFAWRVARFLTAHPDPRLPAVQRAGDLYVDPDAKASHLIDSLSAPDIFLLRREWNFKASTPRHFTEIRVEDARRALHMFHHNAAGGGWRVCIVDCADELNKSSANALLKMVEEPPAKALFLILAHQPGRLLPTIRSRCRKLMLQPLASADIVQAIEAQGAAFAKYSKGDIEKAARAADGSVREAIRILARQGAASARLTEELLRALPTVDWGGVQKLIDAVARPTAVNEYDAFVETVFVWLDARVKQATGQGPRRIAPLADAWEKIGKSVRETEIYNLDKRALILGMFEDLVAATK